jgi:hypothetical protein
MKQLVPQIQSLAHQRQWSAFCNGTQLEEWRLICSGFCETVPGTGEVARFPNLANLQWVLCVSVVIP